ncbi:MAG: type IV toxin-antitoxin system AbiEi family antitoxin domain-containing protein [Akkermansiaceae bacterium]|nr:type IV toxin-antitoxin system AbiEi family antitoxin domain-containing protein [Akkermansiaceae bacterium]
MSVSEKRDKLFEVVESQHGIFTTKQAVDAGYDRNTHAYQVRIGYWIRE